MRPTLVLNACFLVMLAANVGLAANKTYDVLRAVANDSCGGCDTAIESGTIITDGTMGRLTLSNFVSIDLVLTESASGDFGNSAPINLSIPIESGHVVLDAEGLHASETGLFVPFTGATGTSAFKTFLENRNWSFENTFAEWINQEGTGDPGRRVQMVTPNIFGQMRLPAPDGELPVATLGTQPCVGSCTWSSTGGGDYNSDFNWTLTSDGLNGSVPNGTDQGVVLGGTIAADSTIFTDNNVSIANLTFDNATHSYALAGKGIITFNSADGTPAISATSGNHEIQVRTALAEATIIDAGNGTLDFNNEINTNGNTLTLSGAVNVNHSITGGGGVSGSGTLGTASSTGIVGDLTYNGNIDMDITGDSGDVGQVDSFHVTGAADLSGATLNVNVDFSPTSSDSYTLVTASQGIDDSTLNVNLPAGFSYQVVSGNGSSESLIVAFQTGSGVTGDYNGNGTVDAADYTLFRDNLGGDSSILANNDIPGAITWAHYGQWKMGFGSLGVGNTNGAAIPEPASLSLVLLGGMLAIARRSSNLARTG